MRSGTVKPPASISYNNDCSPSSVLRKAWSVYAEAFQAEAGNLGLAGPRFSLPKFIDFLVQNDADLSVQDSAEFLVQEDRQLPRVANFSETDETAVVTNFLFPELVCKLNAPDHI